MVLLLPEKRGQLAETEKALTAAALQDGLNKLYPRHGTVALPRFKMTVEYSLLERLKEMGMKDGPLAAMTSAENLFVSRIVHKAFIEVDEVGTEAAAATAVIVTPKSKPAPPFTFRADHPFLFLIRDNHTGSILFLGRVTDPTRP
jgi:serpin B